MQPGCVMWGHRPPLSPSTPTPGLRHLGFCFFLFFYETEIFIYLTALGLSFGKWVLVPQSGIEPRSPALGEQSLNHWTTGEVWKQKYLKAISCVCGTFVFFLIIRVIQTLSVHLGKC